MELPAGPPACFAVADVLDRWGEANLLAPRYGSRDVLCGEAEVRPLPRRLSGMVVGFDARGSGAAQKVPCAAVRLPPPVSAGEGT